MSRQRVILAALALSLAPGLAAAQGGERLTPVELPAQQAMSGVELELVLRTLDPNQATRALLQRSTRSPIGRGLPELRIGDFVEICFSASRDGHVTVWSRSADDRPVVIYPNVFSHAGADARSEHVAAGETHCIGADDRFRLRVTGQPGIVAAVYVHWTPGEETQLGTEDFPVIGSRSPVSEGQAQHAGSSIEYRIVD